MARDVDRDDHAHDKFQHEAVEKGLDPGKVQLFLCFYYIMTGIHGIHIIIGIGCILWLVWEAWRGTIPR